MKFGDQLQGTIEGLDEKGRGVFRYPLPQTPGESRSVVVPFAAPGDLVQAAFVRRERGSWIGKLERVIEPSPDRVRTPCPHAGTCGGCLWQHLSYDAQLRLKREAINRALDRAGHAERIETITPSVDQFYYRNRMEYVFGWRGELGLKEYGSWNKYLDLSTCLLLDKETPAILETVKAIVKEHGLVPWDAKKHTGDVRYCVIRLGKKTGERMVMLVVKDLARVLPAPRAALVDRLSAFTTSMLLGENPEITDVSYVKTYETLHGKSLLSEEVNGMRYDIHPNSFFQTNSAMAAVLQTKVLSLPGPLEGKMVLDLYCGLGFFGIACAKAGARAYGHELDAQAIELARKNAEANGVADRATFGSGPVEAIHVLPIPDPDVVIVDPPRSGLHPDALKLLMRLSPKTLIYVSCNFHRLLEELKTLKTAYRMEAFEALDLFPQTPHVEVVAKLVRKK